MEFKSETGSSVKFERYRCENCGVTCTVETSYQYDEVEQELETKACTLGATTHNVMLESRGECPDCHAQNREG
jgi:Fe2+ or Zn2+ uptake regulation protein